MTNDFWAGFDPETERAYIGPAGPVRVTVAAAVRMLRTMEPTDEDMDRGDAFGTRKERAVELAAAGHVIDTQIDVWGWGAANTYKLRRIYGYQSVLAAVGNVRILTPPEAL